MEALTIIGNSWPIAAMVITLLASLGLRGFVNQLSINDVRERQARWEQELTMTKYNESKQLVVPTKSPRAHND